MDCVDASNRPAGDAMYALLKRLFPLHRSIAGAGLRESIRQLQQVIPLDITEVASGTDVLDWQVPDEWSIRDAYISDANNGRIVDYQATNLCVLNHSQPVNRRMAWRELREHVQTDEALPSTTPYRTAFFRDKWGFCMPHRLFQQLDQAPDAEFNAVIDAEFAPGSLTLGEFRLPGTQQDEVLLYTHTCHPSLANDNLSSMVVATFLALELAKRSERRYTYRFVFAPATIGAITWLSQNRDNLSSIHAGLVLSTMGDPSAMKFKRTRSGELEIDRAAQHVLQHRYADSQTFDFTPFGYDETHFSSPGFNLPVGRLMRGVNGEFPEYHNSADNMTFVQPETLTNSLETCLQIVDTLEHNRCYKNLQPFGEPRLGHRGLYRGFGEPKEQASLHEAVLWVLNQSDGEHSLLDIAERSGLSMKQLNRAAKRLRDCNLLAEVANENR